VPESTDHQPVSKSKLEAVRSGSDAGMYEEGGALRYRFETSKSGRRKGRQGESGPEGDTPRNYSEKGKKLGNQENRFEGVHKAKQGEGKESTSGMLTRLA